MASIPPSSEGAPDAAQRADLPAIVLSCAAADLEVVSDTARALRERGHEVEVVSGAESEPQQLAGTVARLERQGLYVLCRSRVLDRAMVDTLRAVLRDNDVPFGRTLTLAIESGPAAARALEERIVSVSRRMVTGRGDSGPVRGPAILPPPPQTKVTRVPEPPPGHEPLQDIDRIQQAQARFPVGGAPVADRDPLDESDVDAWADSLAGRPIVEPSSEFEAIDRTSVDQSFDGYPIEGLGTPQATEDAPSEMLRAGDATQVGAPPEDDDEMTQPLEKSSFESEAEDDFGRVDRTLVSPATTFGQPAASAPVPAGVPSAPSVHGSSGPSMGASSGPSYAAEDDGPAFGVSNRLLWVVGSGLGALVLVIVLAVAFSSDDEDTDEPDEIAANDAEEKAEKTQDEAAGSKIEDAVEDEAPQDQDESRAEPAQEAEVEAEDEAEDEADEQVVADPTPTEAAPVVEPEPEPTGDEPPATVEDSKLVLAALESRDVRAFDTFLVAEEYSKDTTFARATAYCEQLEVAGLTGWRLPTIGELWSLGEGKVMKRGLFWSVTLGDAYGEKRLIYNARKDSIAPVPADWDGAQAVCIRARS